MQTPNELLPDGLKMDLLWTNASPTSAFEPQHITIDLSRYNLVCIDFYLGIFDEYYAYLHKLDLFVKSGQPTYAGPANNGWLLESGILVYRSIDQILDDGVYFSAGKEKTLDGTWNNSVMIPYKIYGVK